MNATACPDVSDETWGAVARRATMRERNLIGMGEAPVKYELTGASCHLRTEARVWRRPIKCLLGPLGNRLRCLFLVIGVSQGINRVSRQLIPTGPRGRVVAEFI